MKIFQYLVCFRTSKFCYAKKFNKSTLIAAFSSQHLSKEKKLPVKMQQVTNSYCTRSERATETLQLLPLLKDIPNVTEQMKVVMHQLELTQQGYLQRCHIFNQLHELFGYVFEYYELHITGSTANGLGFNDCDVDLVLTVFPKGHRSSKSTTNNSQWTIRDSENPLIQIIAQEKRKISLEDLKQVQSGVIVNLVSWLLDTEQLNFKKVAQISNLPLIRFLAGFDGPKCDLMITNKQNVYSTQLVTLYGQMEDRFRLLVFTVRAWFKHCGLIGSNKRGLNGYALSMMVAFFLQRLNPPVLPTLVDLQALNKASIHVNGSECGYCQELEKIPRSKNTSSPEELLKGFINFYANFDFRNRIICPQNAEIMTKEDILKRYPRFTSRRINIQDPFDPSSNLAEIVHTKTEIAIINKFQETAAVIPKENNGFKGQPWGLMFLFD